MAKFIKTYDVTGYRCPICGSKNILHRRKTEDYWCRKCGSEFKLNKVSKKKGR